MKDQVRALNEAGVHAAYINSSLTENQIVKALANAKMEDIRLSMRHQSDYLHQDFLILQ